MDLKKEKYIIVEIIPTASKASNGEIIQISALKIDSLKLIDRFDYRLNLDKIKIAQLREMLDYDNDSFSIVEDSKNIIDAFKNWADNLPLLIIDNEYTLDYLSIIPNEKINIFKFLNMEYHHNVFDELMEKYNLEPSNYIVDLLYEALMKEL